MTIPARSEAKAGGNLRFIFGIRTTL
jgi:hypothetical protein